MVDTVQGQTDLTPPLSPAIDTPVHLNTSASTRTTEHAAAKPVSKRTRIQPTAGLYQPGSALIKTTAAPDTSSVGNKQRSRTVTRHPKPISLSSRHTDRIYKPGEIVSICVVAGGRFDQPVSVTEDLRVPDGWTVMFSPETFTLKAGDRLSRIQAIAIPGNTLAGTYNIIYRARPLGRKDLVSEITLPVTVEENKLLRIDVIETPELVIAGSSYRLGARLSNHGNVALKVSTSVFSSDHFDIETTESEFELAVGQSVIMQMIVSTRSDLNRSIRHHVRLTARFSAEGDIDTIEENILTEILPPAGVEMDTHLRLPLTVTYTGIRDDDPFSNQLEVFGSGPLDESGRHRLDLFLRGPDNRGETIFFSKREEYRVKLTSKYYAIELGDHYFGISRLINNYSLSRGATLRLTPSRKTRLGFHWSRDPLNSLRSQWASTLSLELSDRFWTRINCLDQTTGTSDAEDGLILGAESGLALTRYENIQFETAIHALDDGAAGTEDAAHRILLRSERDRHRVIMERIHAGEAYTGQNRDYELTTGLLQMNHSRRMRSEISIQRSGKVSDDQARTATEQGGFTYRSPSGTNYTLKGRHSIFETGSGSNIPGYEETSSRADIGIMRGRNTLTAFLEMGTQQGYGRASGKTISRLSLIAYLLFSPRSSLYLQGQLSDSRDLGGGLMGGGSFLSADLTWRPRQGVRLGLRSSANNLGSSVRSSSINIDSTLKAEIRTNLDLDVQFRHNQTEMLTGRNGLRVALTRRFGVPIKPLTSVGNVRGVVFDADRENREPIPGIVVRLNNLATITDKDGRFSFSAIKPGSYRLLFDQSRLGYNRAPQNREPVTLDLVGGRTEYIEIGIVRVASIHGNMTVFASRTQTVPLSDASPDIDSPNAGIYVEGLHMQTVTLDSTGARVLQPERGLANIMVELSNGITTIRKLTDIKGDFRFTDLAPGPWTLKIHESDLPPHHVMEQCRNEFLLKPEDDIEVNIRVIPRLRTIRILDEIDLISHVENR